MDEIMKYKTELEDGVVEFEVIQPNYLNAYTDERLALLEEQGEFLDLVEKDLDEQITKLNASIDNLTNKADGVDYAVAFCCGSVAGLVDIFFIGEFDFKTAKSSVDKAFEDFVNKRAKDIKVDEEIKKAKENYPERSFQERSKEKTVLPSRFSLYESVSRSEKSERKYILVLLPYLKRNFRIEIRKSLFI